MPTPDRSAAGTLDPKDYRTWTLEYKCTWWRKRAEQHCWADPRKAHLAEDFGSYVVEQVLLHPDRGVNLTFSFYTFHVELQGVRMNKATKFASLDSVEAVKFMIAGHGEEVKDWDRLAHELHFEGFDRTLFLLAWQYGFTRTELVHLTGKSAASLSQIFLYQEDCLRAHFFLPKRNPRKKVKTAAAEYWAHEAEKQRTLATELEKVL